MSEGASTAVPAAAAAGGPGAPGKVRQKKHRAHGPHQPDEREVSLASVVRGVIDRLYAALEAFLKQSVFHHHHAHYTQKETRERERVINT